jgi:hypothetical protein
VGNILVGALLLVTGTLIILAGIALIVAQIISGLRRPGPPLAQTMAGLDWTGIGAVLNGFAAILRALKDWPLPALLILLGLLADGVGIWLLIEKPI